MSRIGWLLLALATTTTTLSARAGDVSGRVEMPATCSPAVSPAVVTLERLDGTPAPAAADRVAGVTLVNQRGLQFEPRVQAIQAGQTLRFTNDDNETHNVHVHADGVFFNESMGHGRPVDFKVVKPGVLRIVCDIHSHMRAYVIVSPTPYFARCLPDGRFRLDGVPDGRYRLHVWHEMGRGTTRQIDVQGEDPLVLNGLTVEATPALAAAPTVAVRPWSEVIDRIGILLAESRSSASKPGGLARARKLAEDAYWEEFEGSAMETAVRRHLGYQKQGEIEGHFRGLRSLARDVAEGKSSPSAMADRSRELMLSLVAASQDLDRLGVTDRTKIDSHSTHQAPAPSGDVAAQQRELAKAFDGVATLADAGSESDAASAMTSAYFDAFEPIERSLEARRPQEILPLEARFNALRGRINSGLKGEALATELATLREEIAAAVGRSQGGGTFATAFFASLVAILREGVEVILLLTMLIALVVKAGQPKALAAIRWGVGAAAVASILTAVALNLFVSTSQGRAREQIEGWVMMVAAGVLFYVSYWLISQVESKRWTEYLKGQIRRGVAAGGFGTLGLTAFLAVYREGAETALMYQAMIGGQGGSRAGLMGIAAGLAVGIVGLAAIYRVIRSTSGKLPLRTFFKVTGLVLFGMAVVFAGNGVFELQMAGVIRSTPVDGLGTGVPWLGFYPNVQVLTVQGLLLAGALAAVVMLLTDRGDVAAPRLAVGREPSREHAAV
jgi:high-affinity iron transporter